MVTEEDLNNEMSKAVLPVTVLIATFAVLGFFGNTLVLYVYSANYTKCNFKFFVLGLSAIDLTACLTTLPGEVFTQLHWFIFPHPAICKVKSFFNVYTVVASGSALLLIAVDRYRKVCQPHGWQINPDLAAKLIAGVIGLSVIPATPAAILWGQQRYNTTYKDTNVTVTICEKDDAYSKTQWPRLYAIVVYIVPNACIMFATFALYIAIARTLFCKKSSLLEITKIKHPNTIQQRSKTGSSGDNIDASDTIVSASTETLSGTARKMSKDSGLKLTFVGNEMQVYPNLLGVPRKDCSRKVSTESINTNQSGTVSDEETLNDGKKKRRKKKRKWSMSRLKRRTLIMFILTAVFVVTTSTYLGLVSQVAKTNHVLRTLSISQEATLFFFYRLYFINSVINPILYGVLDPRFREVLGKMVRRK